MTDITVISLGGSIVAPDQVDIDFITRFRNTIRDYLREQASGKIILIVGGGGPARSYQSAYRSIAGPAAERDQQDWIGIAATRLNGELVRGVFLTDCAEPLVTDPHGVESFSGRILVAAGWKPGFSTDNDAVILAERFNAETVVNLSNISKVYTADPKLDPGAEPLDQISWKEFRAMVGDTWEPGKNLPFDPVAAKRAAELGLRVITAAGKDLPNLEALLRNKPFEGTVIGPE